MVRDCSNRLGYTCGDFMLMRSSVLIPPSQRLLVRGLGEDFPHCEEEVAGEGLVKAAKHQRQTAGGQSSPRAPIPLD